MVKTGVRICGGIPVPSNIGKHALRILANSYGARPVQQRLYERFAGADVRPAGENRDRTAIRVFRRSYDDRLWPGEVAGPDLHAFRVRDVRLVGQPGGDLQAVPIVAAAVHQHIDDQAAQRRTGNRIQCATQLGGAVSLKTGNAKYPMRLGRSKYPIRPSAQVCIRPSSLGDHARGDDRVNTNISVSVFP